MPRTLCSLAPMLGLSLLAAPLAAQAVPAGKPLSTEVIAARALPATVTIYTFDASGDTLGMGSGFLVRASGVVVTNYHVMEGARRAVVILTSGERYDRVQALDSDESNDIAILKIPGFDLPMLPTTGTLPAVGAAVVAVGNPQGLSRTVSTGIVSAVRLIDGRQMVQISAPISPGSSGGPVLNDRGEVVAIATSYLAEGQNLNFAVPVRYAMGLVEGAKAPVSVAAAFGGEAEESAKPSARPSQTERGPQETKPARASRPRASIEGAWSLAWTMSDRTGSFELTGDLLLGANDVGLLLLRVEGMEAGGAILTTLESHEATPDGRVVITFDGDSMKGYQTDAGLYLTGESTTDDGPVHLTAVATPALPSLKATTGLYELSADTKAYEGVTAGRSVAWTGEGAIAVANDSVYVDLYLSNDAGGSVSAVGEAPLVGTRFEITTDNDVYLAGTIANGKLTASWVDERDWGRYKGTLTGRRH